MYQEGYLDVEILGDVESAKSFSSSSPITTDTSSMEDDTSADLMALDDEADGKEMTLHSEREDIPNERKESLIQHPLSLNLVFKDKGNYIYFHIFVIFNNVKK